MSITITTSIKIHANAQVVWRALTQFETYNQWNPFITGISGQLSKGSTLHVSIDGMSFKPQVLHVEPLKSFEWLGHLFIPGIFDGKHRFRITPGDNCVYFEQSECFSGLLVPLFRKKIKTDIYNQFNTMNSALKAYVEREIPLIKDS